jgi:hypothetical protein
MTIMMTSDMPGTTPPIITTRPITTIATRA